MQWIVAAAMLLIPIGGPFVDGAARAEISGTEMEVELVVEVDRPAVAVVAHLVVGGEQPQRSVTLDGRTQRIYGGFVTLPIQDAVVVFELIHADGSDLSNPTSLSELGVELGDLATFDAFESETRVVEDSGSAQRWLFLAIGAGAAALAAFALWYRDGQMTDEIPEEAQVTSEASETSEAPEAS